LSFEGDRAGLGRAAAANAASDYDALPYLSLPISYTQPVSLSALARLHGIAAPSAEVAHTLELGCAGGGNLIPLAARFPKARFTGVDSSAVQIDNARRKSAALGLKNIRFLHAGIETLSPEVESCDYLVCHGVYSWVSADVQAKILDLAGRSLTKTGIAAISYNVLPGWHLRLALREILLRQAGVKGSPQERVARARELIGELSTSLTGRGSYGAMMRQEAVEMSRMPSSYLLGEFLAEHNAPCTFESFAAAANGAGLAYLCETDLNSGIRDDLTPAARRSLSALGAKDRAAAEQKLDDLTGRPFRRSLLVRSGVANLISAPQPERLKGLHLSSLLRASGKDNAAGETSFVAGRNRTVVTRSPAVSRAFAMLEKAYPGTVPFEMLVGGGEDGAKVAKILLRLVNEGLASLFTLPLEVGLLLQMPRAWPLARFEARSGQPYVTSQRHVAVHVSKAAARIVARLDGTQSIEDLCGWVAGEAARGALSLDGAPAEASRRLVLETIDHLARGGVLLAPAAAASDLGTRPD